MLRRSASALAPALALTLAAPLGACTPSHAPALRTAGKVAALGGVGGILAAALATRWTDAADELLVALQVTSAVGVATYAYAELTWPRVEYLPEPLPDKHHRWAKIWPARASGAARAGRCPRVRRLAVRVRAYDPEVYDFVLLRDPEVMRCLTGEPPGPGTLERPALSLPPGAAPAPGAGESPGAGPSGPDAAGRGRDATAPAGPSAAGPGRDAAPADADAAPADAADAADAAGPPAARPPAPGLPPRR
jgi:hypothetical protein